MKSKGGSGRGNKGVAVIDDPTRPDCPLCGGFMKSKSGNRWLCTSSECEFESVSKRKAKLGKLITMRATSYHYPRDAALAYAQECQQATRLIVTCGQNNTAPYLGAMQSLKKCAEFYGAKLAVIPKRYKFAATEWEEEGMHWHKDLLPYLVGGDIEIGNVTVRCDVHINSTTLNPLSGKHGHCGERWVVFGHPQHQMEPVISPADQLPKRMYTTGSCTKKNYTVSDAGEKARFHHIPGALLIENMGDYCFIRTLHADKKGNFYDLDKRFTPKGVTQGHNIEAIVTGDEHVKFNIVKKPTYTAKNSIVKTLKPKFIVRHDILDGFAGSHHHERDPLLQYRKHTQGDNDYRAELDEVIDFVNQTTPEGAVNLIVPSNHHDHLKQWLDKADPNKDHTNSKLILELGWQMREAVDKGRPHDPFYLYSHKKLPKGTKFLSP